MYDLFFKDNLLAYVEFYVLLIMFIYILFYKREFFIRNYVYKFNTLVKFIILVFTSIFNVIVLAVLYSYNIYWWIGVAYNSLAITLIIYLTIAVFFKSDVKYLEK